MLTPAIRASSTSAPLVIIENAFSTQFCVPPFLNFALLRSEMTTGLPVLCVIIVGACPNTGLAAAAAMPADTLVTNVRREMGGVMRVPPGAVSLLLTDPRSPVHDDGRSSI